MPNLERRKEEASDRYNEAEDKLLKFQNDVDSYRLADNQKNPNAAERLSLESVRSSVSNIVLNGPGHGVSDIDRKIAAHATVLKKAADTQYKAYLEASKVSFMDQNNLDIFLL